MKGASMVIMAATLFMILALAIVLALVLVLLAELYCSLLLRRRRQLSLTKLPTPTTTTATTAIATATHVPPPLTSFRAPTGIFFSRLPSFQADNLKGSPHQKLHHFLSLQTLLDSAVNSPPSPPSISQKAAALPPLMDQGDAARLRRAKEHLVYISNPVFDNDSGAAQALRNGEDVMTPPLTPIKDLPTKTCSITPSDARCLGASGSESNSQNVVFSPTYSGSPSTSPSW